jgi:hypothetical protein
MNSTSALVPLTVQRTLYSPAGMVVPFTVRLELNFIDLSPANAVTAIASIITKAASFTNCFIDGVLPVSACGGCLFIASAV